MIDDTNGVNALGGASHQPVLLACFAATTGQVCEIGAGHSSTSLLHALCCPNRRRLVTLETDPEWRDWFRNWNRDGHEILDDTLEKIERLSREKCGVVLLDDHPGQERHIALRLFLDKSDFIVIHDAQDPVTISRMQDVLDVTPHWFHRTYFPPTLLVSKHRLNDVVPYIP